MNIKNFFKELFSKKKTFYVVFPNNGIEEHYLTLASKIFYKKGHLITSKTIDGYDTSYMYMMFIVPEYLYDDFVNSITFWDAAHEKFLDDPYELFMYSIFGPVN